MMWYTVKKPCFSAKERTKMYVKLSIPERLKDLRVERHLTLEELAEATGLS